MLMVRKGLLLSCIKIKSIILSINYFNILRSSRKCINDYFYKLTVLLSPHCVMTNVHWRWSIYYCQCIGTDSGVFKMNVNQTAHIPHSVAKQTMFWKNLILNKKNLNIKIKCLLGHQMWRLVVRPLRRLNWPLISYN